MIYFKLQDGRHLLIVEPANLVRLQGGEPLKSPNNEVMIAYTPDAPWLTEQLIMRDFNFDVKELDEILRESLKRDAVLRMNDDAVVKIHDGGIRKADS
jgi:hypothetical protein